MYAVFKNDLFLNNKIGNIVTEREIIILIATIYLKICKTNKIQTNGIALPIRVYEYSHSYNNIFSVLTPLIL